METDMNVYTTTNQKSVALGRELGKGGEGAVHEIVGQPELVAKVYEPSKRTPERERKLQAMVANPPQDDTRRLSPPHVSIAWPTDLLYDEQRRFVGYVMPRIRQSPNIYEVFNPQLRVQKYPEFSWQYLHRTAKNLAIALQALHARGYVMSDVNQKNVLVTVEALVTLVDTDSFQVRDANGAVYRCPVGVPEYTPPELQGVQLDSIDRNPYHDAFGLAVMVFQLLMEGFHPFTGAPKDPTYSVIGGNLFLDCIKRGIFPYSNNRDFVPPPGAPDFTMLYPDLQQLFLRCFVDGHKNPSARPTALEWVEALNKAENALVQCKKNHLHWYSNHLKECPWCKRGKKFPIQERLPPLQRPPEPVPVVQGVVVISTGGNSFIFPDGKQQANNPQDLVKMIDVNWDISRECLYGLNAFKEWFNGQGQVKLAMIAQDVVKNYPNDHDAGLEVFTQRLAAEVGVTLSPPRLAVSPKKLAFGRVEKNSRKTLRLTVKNGAGRGYISAGIKVTPSVDWLEFRVSYNPKASNRFSIPPKRGACADIEVTVDGTRLRPGPSQATLTIEPIQGINVQPVSIPVTCSVSFPYIRWLGSVVGFALVFGIISFIFLLVAFEYVNQVSIGLVLVTVIALYSLITSLSR